MDKYELNGPKELALVLADALDEKKALDIIILDVESLVDIRRISFSPVDVVSVMCSL